jgi:hypothetical protein
MLTMGLSAFEELSYPGELRIALAQVPAGQVSLRRTALRFHAGAALSCWVSIWVPN